MQTGVSGDWLSIDMYRRGRYVYLQCLGMYHDGSWIMSAASKRRCIRITETNNKSNTGIDAGLRRRPGHGPRCIGRRLSGGYGLDRASPLVTTNAAIYGRGKAALAASRSTASYVCPY
jgi:hypothetical protein